MGATDICMDSTGDTDVNDLTQQDIEESFGAIAEIMKDHGKQIATLIARSQTVHTRIDVLETEQEVEQQQAQAEPVPVTSFADRLRGAINGDGEEQEAQPEQQHYTPTPTAAPETPVQPLNALGLAIPAGLKDKKRNKVDAFVKAGNVSGLNDYMALSVDGSPLRLYASAALELLTRQPATQVQRAVAASVPSAVAKGKGKSVVVHGKTWQLSASAINSRKYRAKKDGVTIDGETGIPIEA